MSDDPVQRVLEQLASVRNTPNGYEARCPAHKDRHASLSVSRGDDGRVLLHCHAGCSPIEVCQAIGLRMGDLFPKSSSTNGRHGRIVATYDYRDTDGTLLYQVVRMEPKRFLQRKPGENGRWEWHLNGTPRVLYRLPELIAADAGEWVFVVEGEKDADRLVSLGVLATTCPQGAGKWSKLADDSVLHGRRVVIVPDRDGPGEQHARDIASRLHDRAAEVRLVSLPDIEGVKDVSDWLEHGGTREQLLALAEQATQTIQTQRTRPTVLIDTDEHRVVKQTIDALTADADIYQRGAILVRVVRAPRQPDPSSDWHPPREMIQIM